VQEKILFGFLWLYIFLIFLGLLPISVFVRYVIVSFESIYLKMSILQATKPCFPALVDRPDELTTDRNRSESLSVMLKKGFCASLFLRDMFDRGNFEVIKGCCQCYKVFSLLCSFAHISFGHIALFLPELQPIMKIWYFCISWSGINVCIFFIQCAIFMPGYTVKAQRYHSV
jgi:hypothetical protein